MRPDQLEHFGPVGTNGPNGPNREQETNSKQKAVALLKALFAAPYGDTTVGDMVCAEADPPRLKAAMLPVLERAFTMTNPLPESAVEPVAWMIESTGRTGTVYRSLHKVKPEPDAIGDHETLTAIYALPAIREAVVGECRDAIRNLGNQALAVEKQDVLRTQDPFSAYHLGLNDCYAALTEQENRNDQERSHDAD